MQKYKEHLIEESKSLKDALERLNTLGDKVTLFAINSSNHVTGSITDGDIRRSLIQGIQIDTPLSESMNRDFHYFNSENWTKAVYQEIKKKKIKLVPYLSIDGNLERIINLEEMKSIIPMDVLIMAGGKGSRLMPLTEKIPKPLLKVGSKAIIEHNVDRLIQFGVQNIHISINHFGEQLVSFFQQNEKTTDLHFIEEDKPLGTLGALGLANGLKENYILVMNSDLITTINFDQMYQIAIKEDADLVVAAVPYEVNIPYAVLETKDDRVQKLSEKPTFEYECNAGMYLIHKRNFHLIPKNKKYNATDLIEDLIENGGKVKTYLFNEYWLDVGKHKDFEKAQVDIKNLDL